MQPAIITQYRNQIQAAYPELAITTAHLNATEGQFSDVLLINNALIFRFPKSPHVAQELASEIPLLKALHGKLPLPIPNVQYIAEAETGGLAFMGYPMIRGQPLLRSRFAAIVNKAILKQIAQELAYFLKTLHDIQPDGLNLSLGSYDAHAEWVTMFADFQEKLFPYMRFDAQAKISANFEAALSNSSLWDFESVLCHGDFGTGNILYADGHITGIIDFTFCGLGDPAQEIGALLASYGAGFCERVLKCYPELKATLPRAHFIMSNYALIQALYALRDNNKADFDDGMQDYI